MRLVDANAYSAEMKDRQEAAWKWRNEAIADEDEVKLARAEGAYTAFTEAKLTMDKHIINPWHRVEEPPKEYGNYLAVVNGEVMEVTYSDMRDDWKWSTCDAEGFVWIRSEFVTHWMPLPEPPKEEK